VSHSNQSQDASSNYSQDIGVIAHRNSEHSNQSPNPNTLNKPLTHQVSTVKKKRPGAQKGRIKVKKLDNFDINLNFEDKDSFSQADDHHSYISKSINLDNRSNKSNQQQYYNSNNLEENMLSEVPNIVVDNLSSITKKQEMNDIDSAIENYK
jgi:hypothetical protein